MIQGLWLQAAFAGVEFSLGMSSLMLLKLLNQSEERNRGHLFLPLCQAAAVALLS